MIVLIPTRYLDQVERNLFMKVCVGQKIYSDKESNNFFRFSGVIRSNCDGHVYGLTGINGLAGDLLYVRDEQGQYHRIGYTVRSNNSHFRSAREVTDLLAFYRIDPGVELNRADGEVFTCSNNMCIDAKIGQRVTLFRFVEDATRCGMITGVESAFDMRSGDENIDDVTYTRAIAVENGDSEFAERGDLGSLVLCDDRVVGVLVAKSDRRYFIAPLNDWLNLNGFEISDKEEIVSFSPLDSLLRETRKLPSKWVSLCLANTFGMSDTFASIEKRIGMNGLENVQDLIVKSLYLNIPTPHLLNGLEELHLRDLTGTEYWFIESLISRQKIFTQTKDKSALFKTDCSSTQFNLEGSRERNMEDFLQSNDWMDSIAQMGISIDSVTKAVQEGEG